MPRIGYLADHWGSDSLVYGALQLLRGRGQIQLERIDDYRTVESLDHAVWRIINLVDVLVADVKKGSSNIYYEIGLAHGMGKPAIVVVEEAAPDPPPALGSQRILRISARVDTKETVAYRLREAIDEALTRGRPFSGPRASIDQLHPDFHNSAASIDAEDFRSLFAYSGSARGLRFERWFATMVRGVPGWEVVEGERSARSDDGFDLVIWNSREDSDLLALGNPIAVELKAIRTMNTQLLSQLLHRARRAGLKAVVFATTAVNPPHTKRLLSRLRNEEGIRAIALDREDLLLAESPDQLLRVFKQKVREVLYDGDA
jgi:hypothetical protein